MLWPIKIEKKVKGKEIEKEEVKECESRGERTKENGRDFRRDKGVMVRGQRPQQDWSFPPPEPHISHYFTQAYGPRGLAPLEPRSLLIFPTPHFLGGCLLCSAWGFFQETPSHVCFIGETY